MALIDDLKRLCRELADTGWAELLASFGLNIRAVNLAAELAKPLDKLGPGKRPNLPGFEDFDPKARRGIEPGLPERSLLYHALASPNVVKGVDGSELGAFPSLGQLETVENYVYGVKPPTLPELRGRADAVQNGAGGRLAIVVFATEYRPGGQTVQETQAATCFSRTGVARVGTSGARYSPRDRGFQATQPGRPRDFCVLPARYAPYIALEHRGPAPSIFGPLRSDPGLDKKLSFWVPLHKIFSGAECLKGRALTVRLRAFHVNEKLARIHQVRGPGQTNLTGPDLTKPPFRFEDGIAELAETSSFGEGLLMPVPHPTLVEMARVGGQLLAYRVPKDPNRLSSSFTLPATKGARRAPEYVHARHELLPDGSIRNLNDVLDVESAVQKGGYFAVHYVDFTGDGWVAASCPELAAELPTHAAYSLVTAPDFYFSTNQRDLMDWWEDPDNIIQPVTPDAVKQRVWPNPPETLSDPQTTSRNTRKRLPPNINLAGSNFTRADATISAIVSVPLTDRSTGPRLDPREPERHAWLPDACSGVFEPGWDVSMARTTGVEHLATYGLGSPFPEDAKLCAALSTFWPAAAPDAARIFDPNGSQQGSHWPTVAPMTDREVGIVGDLPFDGYPGPRLLPGDEEVEYQSFAHADYVESALRGRFSLALTSRVNSDEYKERIVAMARVYRALGASSISQKSGWAVLSYRDADPEDAELQEAQSATGVSLSGAVRRFQVYQHGSKRLLPGGRMRVRVRPATLTLIFLDAARILVNRAGTGWRPA